ncbi:MAG: 30S ribosomal protein S7 [Candidatus Aenigmarchaeota archaeon]|nr:30S ribosomal protein S7 [Candidatus Aenigmarchaeota archaeon]
MGDIKIFNKWDVSEITVADLGLRAHINLTPYAFPKSSGRFSKHQFYKSKMSIVERLINKMMVPGHKSRKHFLTSGKIVGRYITTYTIVQKAFDKIYERTKKNPVEILVRALENAALREEIAGYQVGGIIVRRAVITSPQRRIDSALRCITQATYKKAFGKKLNIVDALVDELIATYNKDGSKSEAIKEKERVEKEAEGAR